SKAAKVDCHGNLPWQPSSSTQVLCRAVVRCPKGRLPRLPTFARWGYHLALARQGALPSSICNFSKTPKTSAADRHSGLYTGKHEDGTSRHPARRTDASGGGVVGDHSATAGSCRPTRTDQSAIAR